MVDPGRWGVHIGLGMLLAAGPLLAQPTAVLQGHVVEAPTGQPLVGATIRLEGTLLGAVTTRQGSFLLRGVPPGEYVLSVSMVGYRALRQAVRLQPGDTLRLRLALEPQPVGFSEVVVTAAKRAQTLQEAPVSIATVEARAFQERSWSRLDEVLRTVPGVTISRDQVSIRGSSGFAFGVGSRTLLLVDGIPLLSGDGGELKYDALPLLAVGRVEILKGAASALYGTAALGGVIHVLTEEPSAVARYRFRLYGGVYGRPRFAEWDVGQRGLWGLDLGYGQRWGSVGLVLSGATVRDESYRSAGDSRRWQLFGKLQWAPSAASTVTAVGFYADDDRGNWIYWASLRRATAPGNPDSAQRVRSRKAAVATQWQQLWSGYLTSTLRCGLYWTDFANTEPGGHADSLPQSTASALSAEWQWSGQLHPQLLWTAGLHGLLNGVKSVLYGDRHQLMGALYGQLELGAMRPVGITVGARLDWERTEGASTQAVEASPRIGLTYASWFGVQFRATLGRAFRAPTVAERFAAVRAAGFTVSPNPELRPERGWSAELGAMDTLWLSLWRWRLRLFADLALFQSDYYDFIEPRFEQSEGAVVVRFANLTRARVQGAELILRTWLGPSASWAPAGMLQLEGGLTMLEPRDLRQNDWLRYRARRLFTISGTLLLPWGELQMEYRYQSRVERVDEELRNLQLIRNADVRVPVHVLDIRATVTGARTLGLPLALTLNVRNALDYYYTEVPGTLAPPRQLLLQLSGEW